MAHQMRLLVLLGFLSFLGSSFSFAQQPNYPTVPKGRLQWRQDQATKLSNTRLYSMGSYLHLAAYYRSQGFPAKAAELYLFGLLRNPDDTRMLRGLLEIWIPEKRYRESLPYATRYVEIAPQDSVAVDFLKTIRQALKKKTKDAVKEALEEAGKKGQGGATASKSEESTKPKEDKKDEKKEESKEAEKKEEGPKPTRQMKLRALRMMKAISAAVKTYNINHPKEKMEKLDIKKLTDDKVLPTSLSLAPWKDKLSIDGTNVKIEGVGDLQGLAGELADYRNDVNRYYELIGLGQLHEALNQAEVLSTKYPEDAANFFPRLFTLLSLKKGTEAEELANKVIEQFKDKPRPLFELLMVQYRSGLYTPARKTADVLMKRFGDSHWAELAREISRLIDRNVGFDLLSNLITARKEVLASVAESKKTTEAKKE